MLERARSICAQRALQCAYARSGVVLVTLIAAASLLMAIRYAVTLFSLFITCFHISLRFSDAIISFMLILPFLYFEEPPCADMLIFFAHAADMPCCYYALFAIFRAGCYTLIHLPPLIRHFHYLIIFSPCRYAFFAIFAYLLPPDS